MAESVGERAAELFQELLQRREQLFKRNQELLQRREELVQLISKLAAGLPVTEDDVKHAPGGLMKLKSTAERRIDWPSTPTQELLLHTNALPTPTNSPSRRPLATPLLTNVQRSGNGKLHIVNSKSLRLSAAILRAKRDHGVLGGLKNAKAIGVRRGWRLRREAALLQLLCETPM